MKQSWPLDVSVSFDPYAGEPNRDGEQYAEVLPDGKVHFRILAKDAHEVVIDRFGTLFPLSPVGEGAWEGTRRGCALPLSAHRLRMLPSHELCGCPGGRYGRLG